jgi:nicotinamidase-related amidase
MGKAVVAIDLHRGHLDPAVATLPLPAEAAAAVVARSARFFRAARAAGIPVVHVVTRYRDREEILSNPAWRRRSEDPTSTRHNMARHNLEGSPGLEVMPGLFAPGDVLVDTKKRYDAFLGTDLDFVLRSRGVDTIFLTGVNTNSCVLATAIEASCRDFDVTVVSDCVDTMDGEAFPEAGLMLLARAFAEVATSDEVLARLGVGAAPLGS